MKNESTYSWEVTPAGGLVLLAFFCRIMHYSDGSKKIVGFEA